MKKITSILGESGFWGALLSISAMLGLVLADDIKSVIAFGFIYVGANIQLSKCRG